MSRFSLRCAASVAAATALVVGGMSLGAGTAVAAPEGSCTKSNVLISKKVLNGGEVAPGGEVRIRTVFSVSSGIDRMINKVTDFHPEGFSYVKDSATLDTWHLIGLAQKTESVTPAPNATDNSISVSNGAGWSVSTTGNKTVTLEASYLAPKDAKVGSEVAVGAGFKSGLLGENKCDKLATVKIRGKNIVEGATSGSADLGFGSADTEGGSGSAGSSIITDPAGFIGSIIGNVIKSAS
ncbi:hypothetical protein FK531_00180 [Rhodococcus spelaei]|uniref:Secreted protein n=1 Tax=Rhodococcus spelaei TaxID=2546320 RepID=A0A541BQF3_9NOCA|nr:hypothetical protein [Rhodococcus spelaei]TQF74573.1 hypothetical protein FK531_00180 [Rhodococcus spelaei]